MQSSGDHQVQHEPEVALEADRDALADPRRSSRTAQPSTAASGGSTVRKSETLATRTRFKGRPTMRGSSALM